MPTTPPVLPTKTSWGTGNVVGATDLNNWGINTAASLTPPGVMLVNTGVSVPPGNTGQGIPTTTITAVQFSEVLRDTDGYFNVGVSTSFVTIPANLGGVYEVDGYVTFDTGVTGDRWVSLYVNGSQLLRFVSNTGPNGNTGEYPVVGGSVHWQFNAGDTAELRCFQNSGATKNILNAAPELATFNLVWAAAA